MALSDFRRRPAEEPVGNVPATGTILEGYSIEVMPRTAEKISDFRDLLPVGTRVYIAHIEGTPITDMAATASRLTTDGFPVMPHFPARLIRDAATLEDWIARYQGEAGIDQALLLAGGASKPAGEFHSSIQLMETGLFGKTGFRHLHVAGHPEGNRDIDPNGSDRNVMKALRWKQRFSETSDARMALTTQFCFEADTVIAWANAIRRAGIKMPIHVGVAGPARLQTLIKFSIACGVGASLRVLRRRARDVTRLLLPFEPGQFVSELAAHKAANPDSNIEGVHFFPLGGIGASANWANENGGASAAPANRKTASCERGN